MGEVEAIEIHYIEDSKKNSVVWDLDRNREIETLLTACDFNRTESFVTTGFKHVNN